MPEPIQVEPGFPQLQPRLFFLGHVSLALSVTALVESEMLFVPDFVLFLPLFYACLWISYAGKGKWRPPGSITNALGLLITVVGGAWIYNQLGRPDSIVQSLPLPTALVPFVGPILVFLVILRLFSATAKRDYWILQGMGLLQVSLACVLTYGSFFAILLLPYLVVMVLILKTAQEQGGDTEPVRLRGSRNGSFKWVDFLQASSWTGAFLALSIPLFLITPRADTSTWNPLLRFSQSRGMFRGSTTGFSEQMNLNRTGEVELSEEVAMTVMVKDATGQPYKEMFLGQRWRGAVLEQYEKGVWQRRYRRRPPQFIAQAELPNFGPNVIKVHFSLVPRKAAGLFLADPVRLDSQMSTRLPVVINPPLHPQAFFFEQGSTVQFSLDSVRVRQEIGYTQVVPLQVPRDRVPAFLENEYLGDLITPRLSTLEDWTIDLINELKTTGRYGIENVAIAARGRRDLGRPVVESIQRERIASALSSYLSRGGEYTYTLDLRRENTAIDPVEDFLFNVRSGHCERYASGLALMLRSIGIPARVIKGFRGCEAIGDGEYVIKNSQAHSWVEVLVPQLDRGGNLVQDPVTGKIQFDWLTLDPTPDFSAEDLQKFSIWRMVFDVFDSVRAFWREMIVEYNPDQQADFWYRIRPDFSNMSYTKLLASLPKILLGLGITLLAGLGLVLGLPRLLARMGAEPKGRPQLGQIIYRRMKYIVWKRISLAPAVGQTPREFCSVLQEKLQPLAMNPQTATLPMRVAELLYRGRFGRESIEWTLVSSMLKELSQLNKELKKKKGAV